MSISVRSTEVRPTRRTSRPARFAAVAALVAGLAGVGTAAPAVAATPAPRSVALPNGWAPEDLANGRGSTFYVSSLSTGGIYAGSYTTGKGRVLVPGSAGVAGLVTELRADGHDRLWAAGGGSGQVRVYDPATGRLLASYQVAPATGASLVGDVVVTAKAAYVTDSFLKQLYVLPLGKNGALPAAAAVRTVPLTGDVVYTTSPNPFNLNGIAVVDGQVVAGQPNTGLLFRIDPRTGVTRRIPVTDAAGKPANLFGVDGFVARGDTLVMARNFPQRITVVELSHDATRGTVRSDRGNPALDIPSAVEVNGGNVWALNARFTTPPSPTTGYSVVRL